MYLGQILPIFDLPRSLMKNLDLFEIVCIPSPLKHSSDFKKEIIHFISMKQKVFSYCLRIAGGCKMYMCVYTEGEGGKVAKIYVSNCLSTLFVYGAKLFYSKNIHEMIFIKK